MEGSIQILILQNSKPRIANRGIANRGIADHGIANCGIANCGIANCGIANCKMQWTSVKIAVAEIAELKVRSSGLQS